MGSTQHPNATPISEARTKWRDPFCTSGHCERRVLRVQVGNYEGKVHTRDGKVMALTLKFRENCSMPWMEKDDIKAIHDLIRRAGLQE